MNTSSYRYTCPLYLALRNVVLHLLFGFYVLLSIKVAIKIMIITTTENIAGKDIKEVLGLVRGNTIRAKHIGKDIIAGLRTIIGGEIKEYVEAMNEAREQSLERMEKQANDLGADAIVGVRFTTSQVLSGAAELLVYGTAVKLKDKDI